jgi:peptidase C25-like protein
MGTSVLAMLLVLTAAMATNAAPTLIGQPRTTLIQSTESVTTLKVDFPVLNAETSGINPAEIQWQQPVEWIDTGRESYQLQPRALNVLAMPTRAKPRLEILDVEWLVPSADADAVAGMVALTGSGIHRGVPLATLTVLGESPAGGILSSIVIRLSHQPSRAFNRLLAKAAADAPIVNPLVLNADLGRRLYASTGDAFPAEKSEVDKSDAGLFSLSANWLKLEIAESGLFEVSGIDMQSAGVNLNAVDPDKLRLFSAFKGELPSDPEAPGAWQPGWDGLTEMPLLLEDEDGTWDSGDVVKFHALGAGHWLDEADAAAQPLSHIEHLYDGSSTYWLTWETYSVDSPIAGAPLRLARQSAPSSSRVVDRHMQRLHLEENHFDVFGSVQDNWAWDRFVSGTRKDIRFTTQNVILGDTLVYNVEFRSYHTANGGYITTMYNGASAKLNGDATETTMSWQLQSEAHTDSLNLQLAGISTSVQAGVNSLFFRRTVENTPLLVLDCVNLMYRQKLIKMPGQLNVFLPVGTFQSAGETINLQVVALQQSGIDVWDLSDPQAVAVYTGSAQTTPTNSFGTELAGEPGQTRRLIIAEAGDYMRPSNVSRRIPAAQRQMNTDADYVVIYGDQMFTAASLLAQHRQTHLPGLVDPQVRLVDAEMIYDSFGGGVKDPLAIRNFLKWLYNASAGRLKYVCMVGDACRDYRNFLNQVDDVLPTYVRTRFPTLTNEYQFYPYATDDHLVSFDRPIWHEDIPDPPDLALGRLTARNSDEAIQMVQRIIDYDQNLPKGSWRNRLVLAADDFYSPSRPTSAQIDHTNFAEILSNLYIPETLDIGKDYLVEFESGSGTNAKFEGRLLARKFFNEGLSIFHYIGHGSPEVLADEQLFLDDDIYGLYNGMKRGLFLAFSCDVGIYDGLKPSMAEVFITQPDGGTIASIAASQVSWINTNNRLTEAFYGALFPTRSVQANSTVSWALMNAKTVVDGLHNTLTSHNAHRYTLLGDPALVLPHPISGPELVNANCDSLRGGHLESIRLNLDDLGFTGTGSLDYDLLVEGTRQEKFEAYKSMPNSADKLGSLPYWMPGPTIFRGQGHLADREVDVSFMVPLQMDYGENARLRLIVNAEDTSWSMSRYLKAVKSETSLNEDFTGPQINLAFEDDRYRVKPGTLLEATIADSSGVSILGTNPLNSILLEYDNSGFLTDISDNFQFDPGRYDQGRLAIEVPDNLDYGTHQVAILASDVLGNVGSDTLSFQFVASTAVSIEDMTVFPNPSDGDLRLIFELSDPMTIDWTIYTVDGRRIWSYAEMFESAGPKILYWDGLDARGDVPANGVYLYTLRGSWQGSGGRDLVLTGQLVVMR